MECKDCNFWDEDEPEPEQDEGKCKHGFCRRYPPVMVGDKYAYPYTDDFAWCGEFKQRVEAHTLPTHLLNTIGYTREYPVEGGY